MSWTKGREDLALGGRGSRGRVRLVLPVRVVRDGIQRPALIILAAFIMALAACGGSGDDEVSATSSSENQPQETTVPQEPEESPDAFMKRLLEYGFNGQFGRAWDELHPGQQAIVSRKKFQECAVEDFPSAPLKSIKTVEISDDPVDLPGILQKTSKAVTLKVTVGQGSTTDSDTLTLHAILLDGRWVWVLQPVWMSPGSCP
jgi:hypothetical protein